MSNTNLTYTVDGSLGKEVCAGFRAYLVDGLGKRTCIGWCYAGGAKA